MNSRTYTRSMSWAWVSSDGGQSFQDLPGLTALSFEQHDFGDEGDMALEHAGHLYFVDTNVEDVTFTRWTVTGLLGQMSVDFHRRFLPAAHLFHSTNHGRKRSSTAPSSRPARSRRSSRATRRTRCRTTTASRRRAT